MRLTTDLSRLKNNLTTIRGRIAPSVSLVLMVKADAYNHGVKVVAPFAEQYVDGFGVSNALEGIDLRVAGILKPISVSAPIASEAGLFARYGLTPMVGGMELLKSLASREEVVSIDLKLDSGFNRFGIKEYELNHAIDIIRHSKLRLRALCTHFMCRGTAATQLLKYNEMCQQIENEFGPLLKHVAASNYVEHSPQYWFDEIRVGVLAYGYGEKFPVKPVLSVTSEIEIIKHLRAGENVGYNALFTADRPTDVGIIRSGYYDGIRRDMRGVSLYLGDHAARIIGAVSMDSFAIDLTGIGASEHDVLEIVSDRRDAVQLAKDLGTVPYEVLTMFKGRNERVFVR